MSEDELALTAEERGLAWLATTRLYSLRKVRGRYGGVRYRLRDMNGALVATFKELDGVRQELTG